MKKINDDVFLYGETGLAFIEGASEKIKQLVLNRNSGKDIAHESLSENIEIYEMEEEFSPIAQQIFLDMRKNMEQYKPEF